MKFLLFLSQNEIIPHGTLEQAVGTHGRKEKLIIEDLCSRGILSESALLLQRSIFYGLSVADLGRVEPDPAALRAIPYRLAVRYCIFPLKKKDNLLTLVAADPSDFFMTDDLRVFTRCQIQCILGAPSEIRAACERYYRVDEELQKQPVTTDPVGFDFASALRNESSSPVAKTVRRIMENAIQLNASDIHLEPRRNNAELRYRIDGELVTIQTLEPAHYPAITARLKVLCDMDIAERRKPQDGRLGFAFEKRRFDFRISTIPTLFGEKIVMRLLDQGAAAMKSLEALGFDPDQRAAYVKAISSKQGIVLITGPTGSGKTTTLYASLNQIKSDNSNITTIEDPIEYSLEGVNQTQINGKIGVTFATMLRSILRQDPDVILVGEIRDRETADIAFRSSLTGHLVFSTLHTNDAVGATTRLNDLGLEPYLTGSALLCIVAQRLVRVICQNCREAFSPDDRSWHIVRKVVPNAPRMFFRGAGCAKCLHSGFRGRTAIYEVLPCYDEFKTAIVTRASDEEMHRIVRSMGVKSLAQAAIEKALLGITSLSEALPFVPAFNKDASQPAIPHTTANR